MSIEFSVAVPMYSSGPFLAETLGCILNQNYPPSEVVVVDDGSTDDTPEVLARDAGKLIIVQTTNSGPGLARKAVVEYRFCEWTALCDSDDIWHKDYLAHKQLTIDTFPDVNLAYSKFSSFASDAISGHTKLDEAPERWLETFTCDAHGKRVRLTDAYLALPYFNIAYTTGTAFTRALYSHAGSMHPRYSRWLAEDAEFMYRMALKPEARAALDLNLC